MPKSIVTENIQIDCTIESDSFDQKEIVARIEMRLNSDAEMCDVKMGEYFFKEDGSVQIYFEARPRWFMKHTLSDLNSFIWRLI